MFHRRWREETIDAMGQPFDLVIIGGGISGCGVFFDAAQRGLRVLLVEQADIASGTSSRSSKLLHGGLRYLKNLQFGVTRESCHERDLQIDLYPHLVTPLEWLYPSYRGRSTPGWKIGLGLWIYDRLTHGPTRHRRADLEEIRRFAPGLTTESLEQAWIYGDARVDDARLTWSVAATGASFGGVLLTYARAEQVIRGADGELRGLEIRDQTTEQVHTVEAPLVVNATGAWVDQLRGRLGLEGRRVRPSRGSHLIFDRRRLPIEGAVTIESPDDRRPVFLIPHPEGVLVGTTDIFHDGSVDDPRPTREEVEYLLRVLAVGYPGNPPTEDDILGAFAGVRPVIANESDDPSAASREEAIWFERGLLSVAGGKLTTWRSTAENVVDEALKRLPSDRRRRAKPCATSGVPLVGLAPRDLTSRLISAFDLEPDVAGALAARLGSRAWSACESAAPEDLRPLRDDVDLTPAELRCHLRHGAVTHLSDLLLRRVRLGMWQPSAAESLAPTLGDVLAREAGWSGARFDRELDRFERDRQGWTLGGTIDRNSP